MTIREATSKYEIHLDWHQVLVEKKNYIFYSESMVGHDDISVDGMERYKAFFVLEGLPKSEYVVLDIGTNLNVQKSTAFLNGRCLGDIYSFSNEVRYCIPVSVLNLGQNEIVIERYGNVYRFSEDCVCETVKKTDDDLSPPCRISIIEFTESGPLEDVESSRGKVSLIYKSMNLDVAFTNNNAVRVTTYKNVKQSGMVDEYCLASDITLDNNIELQKDQIVCGNLRIQYEASNASIAIVDCVKKHTLKFRFLFTDNETLILKKLEKEEKIFGLGENTVN